MPRTVAEILAQADELAKRFEDFDPGPDAKVIDGSHLRNVREAFEDFALAQKRLAERISVARAVGCSWAMIGMMIGTSGEAARQRYGPPAAKEPAKEPKATSSARSVRTAAGKGGSTRVRKPAASSALTHAVAKAKKGVATENPMAKVKAAEKV